MALAIAWLITAGQAFRLARLKRFDEHRVWMVRSYALTYGSVVSRLLLLNVLLEAGLGIELIHPIICWAGWLLTWVVAELWLRQTPPGRP